jgi:rhodanese-related sulfurtransferase
MVEEMDPATLAEKLAHDEDVQVVDIRPERQFERGHIPGADNLPFPSLPQRVEAVDWDEEVVVACPKGESSRQAARLIESYEGLPADARVCNLTGGYREWDGDLARADDDGAASDGSGRGPTPTAGDQGADEGPDAPF